jgi:hypothetical protein
MGTQSTMVRRGIGLGWVVVGLATGLAAQQPIVRPGVSSAYEPVGEARGWTDAASGAPPVGVVAVGPHTRITAPEALTLARPAWWLTGAFSVSATFRRADAAPLSAPYGLTLGATDTAPFALALLMRPDGAVSVQRGTREGAWTALSGLRAASPESVQGDRLTIRVSDTQAECLVNGQRIGVLALAPGELDGRPGVHAGAGAEVFVSGFTVEGPAALFK